MKWFGVKNMKTGNWANVFGTRKEAEDMINKYGNLFPDNKYKIIELIEGDGLKCDIGKEKGVKGMAGEINETN